MLEEFINKRIFIKMTATDFVLLPELQAALEDMKWGSGDNIDSDVTKGYVNHYGIIYLNCDVAGFERKAVYYCHDIDYINRKHPNATIMTVTEFISACMNTEIDIDENELNSVFEG